MTGSLPRLELREISVSLSDQDRRFQLSIPELSLSGGEVLGLSGPSGSGKTMFLEVLGLLRRAHAVGAHRLSLAGESLDLAGLWDRHGASPAEVRGQYFGFVPQSGGLLPFLSVAENIGLSQKIARHVDDGWRADLIDHLGLQPVAKLYPAALSIGQRQRVAIARALAHRPAFVIADEPTAALDPDAALGAMQLLLQAAQEGGAGVIVSSHDLALLDRFGMRRARLGLTSAPGAKTVTSSLSEAEMAS